MSLKLIIHVIFITFAGFISCHASNFSIDGILDIYTSKIYVYESSGYEAKNYKQEGYVEIKKNDEKLEIYFGWEGKHFTHAIPINELKIETCSLTREHPGFGKGKITYSEIHIQYEMSESNMLLGTPVNWLYQLRMQDNKMLAIRIQKHHKDHKDKDRIIESFQMSKIRINNDIYLERDWTFR